MIYNRAFIRSDLSKFDPHDENVKSYMHEVKESDHAWTIMRENVPVCIWGYCIVWEGRHHFWALMSKESARCMLNIIKIGQEKLDQMRVRRMEATVSCDFPQAIKFIERLGFTREGRLAKFFNDGNDAYMYARVAA